MWLMEEKREDRGTLEFIAHGFVSKAICAWELRVLSAVCLEVVSIEGEKKVEE